MKKLKSLTIFFPFFNDEGTVETQIVAAFNTAPIIALDFEVIALHGGDSHDNTYQEIIRMKRKYPQLRVLDIRNNTEGYAVIKHGFTASKKEWVFYTDGDAQYHLEPDLRRLVEKQRSTGVDVVNGYKKNRRDNALRVFFGKLYSHLAQKIFSLPIRDVDCDFRLIRGSCLKEIILTSTHSSILPELIIKLKKAGARFAEIPVQHFPRVYGTSNYTLTSLIKEKIVGDIKLYRRLKS